MFNGKSTLALIPAHVGKEPVLRKNLVEVADIPLIAWTISQARGSAFVDAVVVMTEDAEVAAVAKQWGAEVPLDSAGQRDASASRDAQGLIWALDELARQGRTFDYVAVLEPTSPLRAPGDIDRAIRLLDAEAGEVAGVVSVGEIHHEHPDLAKRVSAGRVVPYVRSTNALQGAPLDRAYYPYGHVYLTRVDILRETGGFFHELMAPMFVERWQCYDIADFYDLLCVESILRYLQAAQQQAAAATAVAADGVQQPAGEVPPSPGGEAPGAV
jgi:CMP-N-acetylneuraminic acid synthetase